MADLPLGVGTGIVRISLRHSFLLDGVQHVQPVVGRVYFTPTADFLRDSANDLIFPVHANSAYLDPNGDAVVELVATNDPQLEPLNYTYEVSFDLEQVHLEPFHIDVPEGSDRFLSDITPVPAANGVYYLTGPQGPAGAPGVGGSIAIQDENITRVAQATILDFQGAGVTVTSGAANEAIVTVTSGTSSTYIHYQSSASPVWTINHGLTYQPNVTVVDSLKQQVFPGLVEYLTATTIRLTFSASLGGEAYLS